MVNRKKNQNKNPSKNRVKKLIKNTEKKKPKMDEIDWSSSNAESEGDGSFADDSDKDPDYVVPSLPNQDIHNPIQGNVQMSDGEEQSKHGAEKKVPPELGGKSIKVTLKKTRSSSNSSSRSRESTQSFKVVKSVPSASKSVSNGEDQENEKDCDKILPKNVDENEKDSNNKSQTRANTLCGENPCEYNNDNIEISSDESEKSFSERPIPVVPVKKERKDAKTISLKENIEISSDESEKSFADKSSTVVSVKKEIKDAKSLDSVIDLETESVPQNSSVVKKECKIKVTTLKDEPLREDNNEIVVLKDNDNGGFPTSKPQNGVEVKEPVKEHKFKVNVRSSVELYAPHKSNLINIPPGQLNGQPNFLTQNDAQFPLPPYNMLCDVCGSQFDSSESLSDHKVAMKHFKCSFKDCEHIVLSSQQEFLDHQRLIHSIMPSPVQQLAHQVQNLPTLGFDQLLQSGVPPMPDNLPPSPGVPNMYTQTLRMPSQPVPMQRPMRPLIRQTMPQMSTRGRNVLRGQRGRPVSVNPSVARGGSIKRPASMPLRGSPTLKRTSTDRNYTNNLKQAPQIARCLSQSLTQSLSPVSQKSSPKASQQDVVNLFSKRGLTISTVETSGNNTVTLPPGVSLNSAVTIIPTSPMKVPNNVPSKVANQTSSYKVSNVPRKTVDTVDLTGPEPKLWPCEVCSKTYTSLESLYEHVSTLHRSHSFSYKCNLCKSSFPNPEMLRRHKLTNHKQEESLSNPFVIPILDLSKSSTVAKLQSMGVTNYVPVAQLDNHGSQYGLPIMNISRPGSVDGLKYTNFFNLGSVRKL